MKLIQQQSFWKFHPKWPEFQKNLAGPGALPSGNAGMAGAQ